MADDDCWQALVMDMGSDLIKFGFSGDDAPRVVIPNLVGKPKPSTLMIGISIRDYLTADEAQIKRGGLDIERPVVNGIVRNLCQMESMWHHTFYNELKLAPEDHPVLFTEHPLNPISNRKDMLSIAMETFNIPGVYFAIPGILNYYATAKNSTQIAGNRSGIFVDCGNGVTSVVPVHQGKVITDAIMRQDWAGDVCTDRLSQLLQERGHSSSVNCRKVVESMKLSTATVSIQPELPNIKSGTKVWENPDGEKLDVSKESMECMEPIFSPDILDSDAFGIHKLTLMSIEKCEQPIQRELCNRIVLSGGTTVCPDFEMRFKREMNDILSNELKEVIEVIALPERKYSTWIGGSILASDPLFPNICISKVEYDEHGPDIAYEKCHI